MIVLADTSVWIEHFRRESPRLQILLRDGLVVCHPFVIGELALGHLRRRSEILSLLEELPQVPLATHQEALELVERRGLIGAGIGWVDVHLLVSAALGGARLWSVDLRLLEAARRLHIDA